MRGALVPRRPSSVPRPWRRDVLAGDLGDHVAQALDERGAVGHQDQAHQSLLLSLPPSLSGCRAMLRPDSSRTKQERVKRCGKRVRRGRTTGAGPLPGGGVRFYTRATVTRRRRRVPAISAATSVVDAADGAAHALGALRPDRRAPRRVPDPARRVLGDGDHGDNLMIGFRAVDELLAELPAETPPGELLRAVGHRLVATVGGASGPLYGTAFLEAGAAIGRRPVASTRTSSRRCSRRPPTAWPGGDAARSATRRSWIPSPRRPRPSSASSASDGVPAAAYAIARPGRGAGHALDAPARRSSRPRDAPR